MNSFELTSLVLTGQRLADGWLALLFVFCSCLVHLSRGGAQVSMFAPDVDQMHVIDHTKGAPIDGEKRYSTERSSAVADPVGGLEARPPAPVKTSQKKMATTTGRKFRESSGTPSDRFLDPLLIRVFVIFHKHHPNLKS